MIMTNSIFLFLALSINNRVHLYTIMPILLNLKYKIYGFIKLLKVEREFAIAF